MKNIIRLTITISLLLLGKYAGAQDKAEACTGITKDFAIKSTLASASFWANLRGSPGSISFESNAIFHEAKDSASTLKQPENFCPRGCRVSDRAVMFFSSTPHKSLTEYEDAEHCTELEKMSSAEPFRYQNINIESVDELSEWIADLSQGDGEHGNDLYNRCDRSCSPRFNYLISRNSGLPVSYTVNALIICGPARDKDDGMYNLNSYFRWSCENK